MYGVIGLFDHETEKYIKKIWDQLSKESISLYAEEIQNRKPHITLASYGNLDVDSFISSFDQFYETKQQLDITFSTIGTFLGLGTLFLSPTLSESLLQFHRKHHEHFKAYNDNPDSLYLPGKWIPHCTIANRLAPEKLNQAFAYCSKRMGAISCKITNVTLIRVLNEENGRVDNLISKNLIQRKSK